MDIKIIEKKKNGRTLCRINGRAYNLPNGLLKTLQEESNLVEALVSPKTADTINSFNIGDEVEISMISEHYTDFVGEKFKIVGIELNKNDKPLYTIKDKYGLSDEWEESDLTKTIG